MLRAVAVLLGLTSCALTFPSPEDPASASDCRIVPSIADTVAAVAIASVAVLAASEKCQRGCGPIESATAAPIAAGALLVGASAGYGYYKFGRCRQEAAAGPGSARPDHEP
nr:hypothetical protein [Kofleriaceae bacterium]